MNKFFLVVVILFGVFFRVEAQDQDPNCYDNNKGENVSFNVGLSFVKVKLTAEKPKTSFFLDGIGIIELISWGKVKLMHQGHVQTGKLVWVIRGQNSPSYVKWDKSSLNPEKIRDKDLRDELDLFAGLDLCGPSTKTFKNLKVLREYDAAWRMEVWGIDLKETPDGKILWTYKGKTVVFPYYGNKSVHISVRNYPEGTFLTFSVNKNGQEKIVFFNDQKNEFIEK
ncbi:MAG: hypothetical protein AAB917_02750 [Patescibacteria group bacterium]